MSEIEQIEMPKTQFSIYKIDPDNVIDFFSLDNATITTSEILKLLCGHILDALHNRGCIFKFQLDSKGFQGFVYQTEHEPDWKDIILQLSEGTKATEENPRPEEPLDNFNVSYILFYQYNDSIYAMTGGFGSKMIAKFIEQNYGLYLLPKFTQRNDQILKLIKQDYFTGNRISIDRTNRSTTSFTVEQDLSGIFKELDVEIDNTLATELGIVLDGSKSYQRLVHLANKDSLVIRRRLSLDDLADVIEALNHLEKKKDHFPLNYMVPIRKKRLARSDMLRKLVDDFANKNYQAFTLVGDSYQRYLISGSTYRILKQDGQTFIQSPDPITLDDIFNKLHAEDTNLTNYFVTTMLREWQIETISPDGEYALYPRPIIDSIQGFIEYGDNSLPCYLINGKWYVFDELYGTMLNKDFEKLYVQKEEKATALKAQFGLAIPAKTENGYNDLLKNNKDIIVAHKASYNNVEIADAIFWDDTKLYLMHNKGKFNGIGARDLLNQILTSAECLMGTGLVSGLGFLRKYYASVCKLNKVTKLPQADEDTFLRLFEEKRICYIAGFLTGYKRNPTSIYAKYLTIETNKKLADRGCSFIPLGIK